MKQQGILKPTRSSFKSSITNKSPYKNEKVNFENFPVQRLSLNEADDKKSAQKYVFIYYQNILQEVKQETILEQSHQKQPINIDLKNSSIEKNEINENQQKPLRKTIKSKTLVVQKKEDMKKQNKQLEMKGKNESNNFMSIEQKRQINRRLTGLIASKKELREIQEELGLQDLQQQDDQIFSKSKDQKKMSFTSFSAQIQKEKQEMIQKQFNTPYFKKLAKQKEKKINKGKCCECMIF